MTKEEILNSEIGRELMTELIGYSGKMKLTLPEDVFEQFKKDQLKKDWEILSFKGKDGRICPVTTDGKYPCNPKGDSGGDCKCLHDTDYFIKKDHYYCINSVKRSDGEVFCVDDVTNFGKITRFTISKENHIIVHCDKLWEWLDHIRKAKQPLFSDHLGNPVYEGDTYWRVILEDRGIDSFTCSDDCIYNTTKGVFLNKPDAESYLVNNARVLSFNDITMYTYTAKDAALISLIKERLNLK